MAPACPPRWRCGVDHGRIGRCVPRALVERRKLSGTRYDSEACCGECRSSSPFRERIGACERVRRSVRVCSGIGFGIGSGERTGELLCVGRRCLGAGRSRRRSGWIGSTHDRGVPDREVERIGGCVCDGAAGGSHQRASEGAVRDEVCAVGPRGAAAMDLARSDSDDCVPWGDEDRARAGAVAEVPQAEAGRGAR